MTDAATAATAKIPLLPQRFQAPMARAIMSGLAVATVPTLLALPPMHGA